jgi:hypothetical protein
VIESEAGHITMHMGKIRDTNKMLTGKPQGKRQLGVPKFL